MTSRVCFKMVGLLLIGFVLAAACSSESGSQTSEFGGNGAVAPEEAAPVEQIDSGSGGVAALPIDALLTIQPSFGFGAYSVNADTGVAVAVPVIDGVESLDRNNDVIVSGDAGYALGSTVRQGQSFASDVSIVKFDYTTGQAQRLSILGADREFDDSQETTNFQLLAVAGDSVVVSASTFSGSDPVYAVYDAQTGEQTSSFDAPRYELSFDSGSCAGGVTDFVGLSDGRLGTVALDSPALIDLSTGEIELLIDCDEELGQMADFVSVADVNDYAVFNEGAAPTESDLEQLLTADLEPEHGFIEGGGDLWWLRAEFGNAGEAEAVVGGVVQFDLATQAVEAVHPLGEALASFMDCAPGGTTCEFDTIDDAQLRYLDGKLVFLQNRDDAQLFTFDPTSGELIATSFDPLDADFTISKLLAGDRNSVWIEVRRMTITSETEDSRTAAGKSYLEQLDSSTGQITQSISGEGLFG